MRISDWSSDVCSSDLVGDRHRLDASFISQWAEACAAPLHKLLFGRCCLWHEHDIDAKAWHPTMERSKRLAEEVAMRLTLPDSVLLSEDPLAFLARSARFRRKHGKPLEITAPSPPRAEAYGPLGFRLLRALASPLDRK